MSFFSRTCLSTYFIKRKAYYKHNLMLAKQELIGTSTQRSNNREKTEKRPTKTNSHSTSRTTTTEQNTSPTRQDPRNNLTQMNLHEEQHHRGRQWPRKQPMGGQASTRISSSTVAKHPPETTNQQRKHGGKASDRVGVTRTAKYPPGRAK